MRQQHETEFHGFVESTSPRLLTTAWMLTGDPAGAEDLVQETLERVYVRWGRLRGDNPVAYARRVLVNLHTDRWRKTRREVLAGTTPELVARSADPTDRVSLVAALQQLPTRERECVVLRHYLDLSERETATTLGVSVGTVKSSTSRGLAGLRAIMMEEGTHV